MALKQWVCSWKETEIAVEVDGTRMRLLVNGDVVDEETSVGIRRVPYLLATAPLLGEPTVVEAVIGASGLRSACKIFADGELVGGDREASFRFAEPLLWEKIRSKGRLRFTVKQAALPAVLAGLPTAGLLLTSDMQPLPSTLSAMAVALGGRLVPR